MVFIRKKVLTLGYMGPQAKDAVPIIKKLLQDPNLELRELAKRTLKNIEKNQK